MVLLDVVLSLPQKHTRAWLRKRNLEREKAAKQIQGAMRRRNEILRREKTHISEEESVSTNNRQRLGLGSETSVVPIPVFFLCFVLGGFNFVCLDKIVPPGLWLIVRFFFSVFVCSSKLGVLFLSKRSGTWLPRFVLGCLSIPKC